MSEEIYYSVCEDDWKFADESIEVVAENFLEGMTIDELKTVKTLILYKGVNKAQKFEDFLCVDSILEQMHERAYDVNEFAEDYLYDVTDQQKKELENLIIGWADKHNISPRFSLIENVEKVEYEVSEDRKERLY